MRHASSSSARCAGRLGQTSNAMAMSTPKADWSSIARSGVRKCRVPSSGARNSTPSSVIRRREARLMTWNPPESVRIAPFQPMNACSPPAAAIVSTPGRAIRWYVFASTTRQSQASSQSKATPLTAPRVPTGMKQGVSTAPWRVSRAPARADEDGSRAPTRNKTPLSPRGFPLPAATRNEDARRRRPRAPAGRCPSD